MRCSVARRSGSTILRNLTLTEPCYLMRFATTKPIHPITIRCHRVPLSGALRASGKRKNRENNRRLLFVVVVSDGLTSNLTQLFLTLLHVPKLLLKRSVNDYKLIPSLLLCVLCAVLTNYIIRNGISGTKYARPLTCGLFLLLRSIQPTTPPRSLPIPASLFTVYLFRFALRHLLVLVVTRHGLNFEC